MTATHPPRPPAPAAGKAAVRARLSAAVRALPAEHRREAGSAVAARVTRLAEWRAAGVVMLYVAMDDEVPTAPLALAAWQAGKTVCVPRIGGGRTITPVAVRSLADGFAAAPGLPRVMQPTTGATLPPGLIDFVAVPGVGFTAAGDRLGRGGGYYDRFLARRDAQATTCGIAFDEQLTPDLPTDPHDVPLHLVATPSNLHRA